MDIFNLFNQGPGYCNNRKPGIGKPLSGILNHLPAVDLGHDHIYK